MEQFLKNIDFEHLFVMQDLYTSTATLAIMVDSTSHSISKMYNWPYSNKNEMKELGGKINQMKDKSLEFFTLGISKIVEDFFNNLERFGKIKLRIWDNSLDPISFSKEVRLIRHLGNVIKHNNSIIESALDYKSSKALVDEFCFEDDSSIPWSNIFKYPERDSILKYIYKANYFCFEILSKEGLLNGKKQILEEDAIVEFMLNNYVHSIPGYPNNSSKF